MFTGAQIEKTTNKEACRDLSGRRLRDINQEKRVKDQLEKRAAKERERREQRQKKFEKLKEQPKHMFNDCSFYKEQEEITNSLFSSIDKGLKAVAEDKQKDKAGPSSFSASSTSRSDSGEESDSIKMNTTKATKRKADNAPKGGAKKKRFHNELDDSSDDSDWDDSSSSL